MYLRLIYLWISRVKESDVSPSMVHREMSTNLLKFLANIKFIHHHLIIYLWISGESSPISKKIQLQINPRVLEEMAPLMGGIIWFKKLHYSKKSNCIQYDLKLLPNTQTKVPQI